MNKLLLIFCLMFTSLSFGQYDTESLSDTTEKDPKINPRILKERIYVGGDFSLSFGNLLYLYIAPIAGYDIYKGISAGISPMYQLYRINQGNGGSVSYHSYGCGIFTRYRPERFPPLLVQTEFAVYNTNDFSTSYPADRINVPSFFTGLGYAGSLGGKNYYQFMLKYDLINNPNNPLPKLFFNIPLYLSYGMVFYLG